MSKNSNLQKAKQQKNDEFYTQYDDIQQELNHYEKHFAGKTVYCNCDDPVESQFTFFFLKNFNHLKIKRLICTCYKESPIAYTLFDYLEDQNKNKVVNGGGYVLDVKKIPMKNGRGVSDDDIKRLLNKNGIVKKLKGDGDFRSDECLAYMKECDIVVTNPPFSLFREFVDILIKYKKEFLIIGNKNAVNYKNVFPLIKDNKIWLGYGNPSKFFLPNGTETKQVQGLCRWFTNLDIDKRHEDLILYKTYKGNEKEYPKYDNYNAINVDAVADIPKDYKDVMGVPITFLDKYNPEQFELVGHSLLNCKPIKDCIKKGDTYDKGGLTCYLTVNKTHHKRLYGRLFIRRCK